MGNMDQPGDEQFHVHNRFRVPLVTLCVKTPDFIGDEDQQFHQHLGQDVLVHSLYVEHQDGPGVMERVGEWCPVCGFEPTTAFAAYQLDTEMAQFHTEDHGE